MLGRNTLAMILTIADQCKLRLMGSRAWPTLLSEFAPLDQDMGSLYIMFINQRNLCRYILVQVPISGSASACQGT